MTSLPAAEEPPVSMALQGQGLAPPTLSTFCSPHSPGLKRTGGKEAPAVWPKPSPPSPLESAGSELCRGLEGKEPSMGALSQQFSHKSLILTKQPDFFKKEKKKTLGSRMETIRQHPAVFERTHWFQRPCFL